MNVSLDLNSAPKPAASQAVAINTNSSSPAYQAFRILHVGFVAAPILAGLDKFFHLLVNWDQYVPSLVARLSPIGAHNLMLVVGVVEMVAGLASRGSPVSLPTSSRRGWRSSSPICC